MDRHDAVKRRPQNLGGEISTRPGYGQRPLA